MYVLYAAYGIRCVDSKEETYFIQPEEAQFFDNCQGADFLRRSDLTRHLQANLDNFYFLLTRR
jgi:hypothetical protein